MSSSSYAPGTNLWLERSRLDGMMLSAVSYGIFFLLTMQATVALIQRPRYPSQTAHNRWVLLGYVWITFTLATIGFAGNAQYTEMIWIDLRNVSGGPTALILNELDYRINMMALTCYYIMEWLMQALLLHRCFIVWNWKLHVVVPMSTLFVAMVAMSIIVLAEASGTVFYNINYELVYLCLQVGLTIVYTLLVAGRLFSLRNKIGDILGRQYVRPYDTVVIMVVESAALYSVFGIIFIFSFALHSNVSNLVLLSVSNIQGIAQLLIIIRVAGGRAFDHTTSRTNPNHTSVAFSRGLSQKDSMHTPDSHLLHPPEWSSTASA
ncbi:hypothetical protein J3R82DRAFT_3474 [Butyriboletus roseoflavus]|nr:hypothetical protein J3R82DRAFT_3474 [Butyriboletus roseoflavus]